MSENPFDIDKIILNTSVERDQQYSNPEKTHENNSM